MMLIFAGCLAIAASIFILRRKGTGPNGLRAKRLAARLVLTGSVGLFLSSAMLYVTYRPYAEILDRILKLDRDPRYADLFDRVLKGDMSGPYAEDLGRIVKVNSSGIDRLRSFLAHTHDLPVVPRPPGWDPYGFHHPLNFAFYFWLAVILFSLVGLLLVAIRHLRSHTRARVPA